MNRPLLVVRAAALFAASSLLLLAVSAASTRGWRPASPLPALQPGPEEPLESPPDQTVAQVSVSIPADPADPKAQPLRAWVLQPSAPSMGVVLIAGAGSASRDTLLSEASALARAGVAAIVYDKRTRGYGALTRDYRLLADDAIRAADVLRARTGVDDLRIGLMGWSEGGWVAPTALERAPGRFAFVALISAPIVSPVEQASWVARAALPAVPAWLEKTLATALGAGRWLVPYLDFDVAPALAALEVPVWAAWGADDHTVPVNQAARTVLRQVRGPVSAHILPGLGHSLPVESGYMERAAAWMRSLGDADSTPVPDVVLGSEPSSRLGVGELPTLSWPSHPLLHLALSLAVSVASLGVRTRRRANCEGVLP